MCTSAHHKEDINMKVDLTKIVERENLRKARDYAFVKKTKDDIEKMTDEELKQYKADKKENQDYISLKNNIKKNGQIVPVVVKEEDGKLILVAGYRRFNALSELHAEEFKIIKDSTLHRFAEIDVVFTKAKDLNEVAAVENTARKNFSPEELQVMVWEKREKQEEDNKTLAKKDQKGWQTIADYYGISKAYVRKLYNKEYKIRNPKDPKQKEESKTYNLQEATNRAKTIAKDVVESLKPNTDIKVKLEVKQDLEAIIKQLQEQLSTLNKDPKVVEYQTNKRINAITEGKDNTPAPDSTPDQLPQ